MAKIRTIRPDFWSSPQIAECSREARLLFIGIWNFCDDAGIHPASLARLKMQIFPGDNLSTSDIAFWIEELQQQGLLISYQAEGKPYWQVTGWHHQKIDRPYYRFPKPESNTVRKQCLDIEQTTVRQCLEDVYSPQERNGLEGNVVDKDIANYVTGVFDHWKSVMNCPKAKLDSKRRKKIEVAYQLGFSTEELKQAIEGCASSKWHMGENDQKRQYNGIDLIFRDTEHIEKFINLSTDFAQKSNIGIFEGAV